MFRTENLRPTQTKQQNEKLSNAVIGNYNCMYCKLTSKSQIPLRYLVADRSEAGRRPAASRNLAYHLARANRSAISFEPVCDQIA